MSAYQGRALRTRPATRKGPPPPWRFFVHALAALAVLAIAAHVPWKSLRRACLSVGDVRVEGNHYLDAASIVERSGIRQGEDLLGVDEARARQALLLDSRIAYAEVARVLPHSVRIRVRERMPGCWWLTARGSIPGALLEPLERGVVADVPLPVGPPLRQSAAGSQVRSPRSSARLALDASARRSGAAAGRSGVRARRDGRRRHRHHAARWHARDGARVAAFDPPSVRLARRAGRPETKGHAGRGSRRSFRKSGDRSSGGLAAGGHP